MKPKIKKMKSLLARIDVQRKEDNRKKIEASLNGLSDKKCVAKFKALGNSFKDCVVNMKGKTVDENAYCSVLAKRAQGKVSAED